ncbi:tRNA uridine-5-carboxymethylaminomethyl(34) synthesis GTPase MnmE [Candidatus Phytoplasma prunorum]|uniref:tRNA uridine-5-carboxymethylaminomethyl(34) synthesis GTPase MnmE n=1 Tax=Candidatus Phytoplasma prunorum TaxID=47565 RepID=UPI002FEF2C8B
MIFDTIAAIITPFGTGGVSIIRISGTKTIEEIKKIFKGKDLNKMNSHTITHGFILNKDNIILDEVLLSLFKNPKSFTGEDVIEIHTHGGILITQMVLERILELNIRISYPGEFSQRAYLNRKIDLIQAESIMDLIYAKNENAIKIANLGLQKKTSQLVIELREKILNLISQIEVNIDYPEYEDTIVMSKENILPQTKLLIKEIRNILKHSYKTRYLKEGVETLIIGRPNVGKSSLLNFFLKEERSIVSDVPGTTRDFVDVYLNLQGITLHLIDTAGVRKSENKIEKIGILKTKKLLKKAELVLLVLDQSNYLQSEDKELLNLTKDYPRILIGNKSDLETKIETQKLKEEIIFISTIKKKGLKILQNNILKILKLDVIKEKDFNYLSNTRHIQQIKKALCSLEDASNSLQNNIPVDICVDDFKKSYQFLGLILGEYQTDNLIKNLFSKFCLGK